MSPSRDSCRGVALSGGSVTTALERVETVLEDRTPDDEDSTAG